MSRMRALVRCGLSVVLVSFAACAGQPQPQVKIRYSDAAAAPAAPALTETIEPGVQPARSPASVPGAPVSTREAMDKAVAWSAEGLRAYERGELDVARKSLSDARLILLEADLPDFWKDQGLAAIQSGLPEELRHHDLEALFAELERKDRPDAAELAERAAIEAEVRRILRQFGDSSPNQASLDMMVQETQRYIGFYRGKHREFFQRSYLRKHKYWPMIQEVLAGRGLPGELGYIAFVESGFYPKAVSHADAHGLWQFIPETGRRYGLLQPDDLYDVRKSTQAAAEYLSELLSIFGSPSFLLAAAAYNAGEGRILRCLRNLENPFEQRSFWGIRSCLAVETQEYPPKILAAAVASADPARYGFHLPTEEEMRRRYDVVVVPHVLPLARLAGLAGIDLVDLRLANDDLGPGAATTPSRNFPLFVPAGTGSRLAAALSSLPSESDVRLASAAVPSLGSPSRGETRGEKSRGREGKVYVVRRGDTLSSIARKHGVDLQSVAEWNQLRSPYNLSVGQRLVLPPERGSAPRVVYTVRRGDTLAAIARRFGVSLESLLDSNGLSRRAILRPGQRLVVEKPAR